MPEQEQRRQSERETATANRSKARTDYSDLLIARDSVREQADALQEEYDARIAAGEREEDLADIYAQISDKRSRAAAYDAQAAEAFGALKNAQKSYKDVYADYNAARKELRAAEWDYQNAMQEYVGPEDDQRVKDAETRLASARMAFEEQGGNPDASIVGASMKQYGAGMLGVLRYGQELNRPENAIKLGPVTIGGGDDRMPAEMRAAIEANQKADYEEKHGAGTWKPAYQRTEETAARLQRESAEDLASIKAGRSELAQFGVDAASQGVQMGVDAAAGLVLPGGSLTAMALRTFGASAQEAKDEGATLAQQGLYGASTAAVEVLTEKLGGMSKVYGANLTDGIISHAIGKFTTNRLGQAALGMVADAAGEGLEEVISDLANPVLKSIYDDHVFDNGYFGALDASEVLYDFLVGAALGMAGGSVESVSESTGLSAPDARSEYFMEAGQSGMTFAEALESWKALQETVGDVGAQVDAAFDVLTGKETTEQQQMRQSDALQKLGFTKAQTEAAINENRYEAPKVITQDDRISTINSTIEKLESQGVKDDRLVNAIAAVALQEKADRTDAVNRTPPSKQQQRLVEENEFAQEVVRQLEAEAIEEEKKTKVTWHDKRADIKLNGESVKIVGAEDGKVIVQQNGEKKTVEAKDLEGLSAGYRHLVDLASTTEGGTAMLEAYRPGQDVNAYARAWDLAENMYGAQTNVSFEEARERTSLKTLTDAQLKTALDMGRERYNAKQTKAEEGGKQFKAAREEAKKRGATQRKKGTVSYGGGEVNGVKYKGIDKKNLSVAQKRVVAMVEALADAVNIDYVLFEGEANTGGSYIQGGTIYINIKAGEYSGKTLGAATLSHELTHFLQEFAPEEYQQLKDFLISEILKQSPAQFEKLVQKQLALEPDLNYDQATDEMIANACQKMLLNSEAVTKLARQNMNLAEKIRDVISEISDKIKAAFESVDMSDNVPVFEAARSIENVLDRAQALWDKALEAATENYNAARATGMKSEGGVQYQKTTKESDSIRHHLETHQEEVNAMDAVASIRVENVPKDVTRAVVWATEKLKPTGYKVDRQNFGTIIFDESHIREALRHITNRPDEMGAVLALPRVLKRGKIIEQHENHKGRVQASFTIAAPIEVNGVRGNMAVIVQRTTRNFYHAHRVLLPDNSNFTFTTEAIKKNKADSKRTGELPNKALIAESVETAFKQSIAEESEKSNTQNQQFQMLSRLSSDELQDKYDSYINAGKELQAARKKLSELQDSEEYGRRLDKIFKVSKEDRDKAIEDFNDWQTKAGIVALTEKVKTLQKEYDRLRKEYDTAALENEKEQEREAIEKSSKSEADYFRDKAVKEFGYTPYYYDAGYIVPNGKMLNFSGEKGRHFGSRGQDHRAIGTIFTGDISGSEAMLKFMGQGNIRIMAETPGIDISKDVEPTKEQYAQIRKFASQYAKEEYFGVDFTDERGNTVGSLEYDGRVRPDRVINDIKHFYATGDVREQGLSQFYQKLGIGETAEEQQARREVYADAKKKAAELRRLAAVLQEKAGAERITARPDDIRTYVKKLKDAYSSSTSTGKLFTDMWNLANRAMDGASFQELHDHAEVIAREILHGVNNEIIDKGEPEKFRRLEQIVVDRNGKYNSNVKINEKMWAQLQEAFGKYLFPDTADTEKRRKTVNAFHEVWSEQRGNPYVYNEGVVAYELANDIMVGVFDRKAIRESNRTLADRYENLTRSRLAEQAKRISQREKAAKWAKVNEVKAYYRDMMKRQQTRRSDSAMRKKIRKVIDSLNGRLSHPVDKKYVPKELVSQTVALLELIDTDTGRGSVNVAEKMARIRAMYERYKNDPKYGAIYDELVSNTLDKLALELDGTKLKDMNSQQLEHVLEALQMMDHMIHEAVSVKIGNEEREAAEVARGMMNETNQNVREKEGVIHKWYVPAHLRADVMFKRFAGYKLRSEWEGVARMLNDGQLKQTQIKMQLSAPFAKLINDTKKMLEYQGLNSLGRVQDSKLIDIGLKDADGNAIKVTHDIAVGIYMDLLNEDNRMHFINGGKKIPNLQKFYNGDFSDAFGIGARRAVGISERLDELERKLKQAKKAKYGEWKEQIEAEIKALKNDGERYAEEVKRSIEAQMTDFDRAWIDTMQQLFDVESKKLLNETTMEVYGIEKAQVDNYFPIISDPAFLTQAFEEVTKDMNLENVGFMKERVKSDKPTLAMGSYSVVNRQIDRVAQYCGLMPAVRNFNKIWDKQARGYSDSLKEAVRKKFGDQGLKWVGELMADLQGSRKNKDSFGFGSVLSWARGNLAQTSLTLNLRVAWSQAASYPTAAAELDAKSLARAFKHGKITEEDRKLIAKWSPLLAYRMQGYSTVELGDIKNSNRLSSRVWKKMRWATGWIQAIDGATVARLWPASEYWVQDHMPELSKGSDAYYEAVAKKFNDVIEKTQPNYTTMQRATILRSPSDLTKALTMFMTQRLQNANILYDSAKTFNKAVHDFDAKRNGVTEADVQEAKETLVRAVASQLAQTIVFTAFRFAANVLLRGLKKYRDDDDELTLESVSLGLLDDFCGALAGTVILGDVVYDAIMAALGKKKWYGISVNGVERVSDLVGSLSSLGQVDWNTEEGKKRGWKKIVSAGIALCEVFSLPLNNAKKIVLSMYYWAVDISRGRPLSFEAGYDWLTESKQKRYEEHGLKDLGIYEHDIRVMMREAETNGNQGLAQEEVGPYLRNEIKTGRLTREQADAIWWVMLNQVSDTTKSFAEWLKKNS